MYEILIIKIGVGLASIQMGVPLRNLDFIFPLKLDKDSPGLLKEPKEEQPKRRNYFGRL